MHLTDAPTSPTCRVHAVGLPPVDGHHDALAHEGGGLAGRDAGAGLGWDRVVLCCVLFG